MPLLIALARSLEIDAEPFDKCDEVADRFLDPQPLGDNVVVGDEDAVG